MRRLFALVLLLISAAPAFAVNPDEVLKDPALEARARALSAQLRCMVCQNQSIDDSNADLAKDLRLLVRERLTAGDSDDEVIEYLVSRYGEFVLLKPRLSEHTILLWGMPAALAAIGAGVVLMQLRRKRISSATQDLSEEEQRKLEALLKDET
ncbi:cytochrome c-type biogenesis protein [Rhizobium sp. FKL33]|uniref:cytochrome c-type biogenesis protein n=1 Tax=Rhizobium sp. FKL33 TaxID=2562307 RepID=UPI0010C14B0D|nr:cytochrome c-type biogenesis protein [Rhizobium sp. FKL33]